MVSGQTQKRDFKPFQVSVPCRIDIGGTWDLKALALPLQHIKPATVTIALNMRTEVAFIPNDDGTIKIEDGDLVHETTLDAIDFRHSFGLLLSVLSYYQVSGLDIKITRAIPHGSGLGGSSALAAAVAYGCELITNGHKQEGKWLYEIVGLIHDIEEGFRYSHCGMQDQCAALYGGVQKWTWEYGKERKFERDVICGSEAYQEISSRLLLAYVGRGHDRDVNQKQIDSFLSVDTRDKWLRINLLTHTAAEHVKGKYWNGVVSCIREENSIRLSMVPERLPSEATELYKTAIGSRLAFGIAGAGAGGCVFAFGIEPDDIDDLAMQWKTVLSKYPNSKLILRPEITGEGMCQTSI